MEAWKLWFGLVICLSPAAQALTPDKLLTQYSQTTWTQQQGLPQDTIQSITQTGDGYLWLGTAEGLARFDGYEFTVFDKDRDGLPSNWITTLESTGDGSLWIGTPNGLAQRRSGRFRTYTTKDGLPDNAIVALLRDHSDRLWIIAGLHLVRMEGDQFTVYPVGPVRAVCEDRQGQIWVGGFNGIAKLVNGSFETVLDGGALRGHLISRMAVDKHNNLWVAGSHGLLVRSANGAIAWYGAGAGLPDTVVRTVFVDRDGNIWAGTNGGAARFDKTHFSAYPASERTRHNVVLCIFGDEEANLWVGGNGGLTRLKDDMFTVYGTTEGLPSDLPNAVFQDRAGKIWIGFHDSGLMQFEPSGGRLFGTRKGLSGNEVLSIHQASNDDLLISTSSGLSRMHQGTISRFFLPDPLSRRTVYDAIEDQQGAQWLATSAGLAEVRENNLRWVVPASPLVRSGFGVLCESRDGTIWAGTLGDGIWRVTSEGVSHLTTRNGLSSDAIRSLFEDGDHTLWIGTFGGGLNAYRDGKFQHFTVRDGLLSNNVYHVIESGGDLWLATTRGICRVRKSDLRNQAAGKISHLTTRNYGVQDGLRSAQCAPNNFVAGGGMLSSEGDLWFPTSRGVAVLKPGSRKNKATVPKAHILEIVADGRALDFALPVKLTPGTSQLQIRYSAIHLSAPESVEYSYRLEGLDPGWTRAGSRRLVDYSHLRHGWYRFAVRAELANGLASEQVYSFSILPHFYETSWFLFLCGILVAAAAALLHQLRLRQIRARFRAVLEERTRLAREIHDTLAQGFVGISSQLEAVAVSMHKDDGPAAKYLDTARKMARHSITEARRAVMDLRASILESEGLTRALEQGTRLWTARSGVALEFDLEPPPMDLPVDVEQQILRITQEAVANALQHAHASKICVRLHTQDHSLRLQIADDGRGFDRNSTSPQEGHFGIAGMKERAQRISGELRVDSRPGRGTEVNLTLPLR